jgi:hypothetical protein
MNASFESTYSISPQVKAAVARNLANGRQSVRELVGGNGGNGEKEDGPAYFDRDLPDRTIYHQDVPDDIASESSFLLSRSQWERKQHDAEQDLKEFQMLEMEATIHKPTSKANASRVAMEATRKERRAVGELLRSGLHSDDELLDIIGSGNGGGSRRKDGEYALDSSSDGGAATPTPVYDAYDEYDGHDQAISSATRSPDRATWSPRSASRRDQANLAHVRESLLRGNTDFDDIESWDQDQPAAAPAATQRGNDPRSTGKRVASNAGYDSNHHGNGGGYDRYNPDFEDDVEDVDDDGDAAPRQHAQHGGRRAEEYEDGYNDDGGDAPQSKLVSRMFSQKRAPNGGGRNARRGGGGGGGGSGGGGGGGGGGGSSGGSGGRNSGHSQQREIYVVDEAGQKVRGSQFRAPQAPHGDGNSSGGSPARRRGRGDVDGEENNREPTGFDAIADPAIVTAVQDKLKELDVQIAHFKAESIKVERLREEKVRESAMQSDHKKDLEAREAEFAEYKQDQTAKLKRERRVFETHKTENRVSGGGTVRVFDRNLHSRMPLVHTPARFKRTGV